MRRMKPPVGWEHVKNCFPIPNELLEFDLPGGAIAVYIYLLRHADRRTGQCHPSTATIAKKLHYCRNTVANYVRLLEERGLIVTENTEIITKRGIKKNGNLLYTLVPMHEVTQAYYDQQFAKVQYLPVDVPLSGEGGLPHGSSSGAETTVYGPETGKL